jgi:hypothetical protein
MAGYPRNHACYACGLNTGMPGAFAARVVSRRIEASRVDITAGGGEPLIRKRLVAAITAGWPLQPAGRLNLRHKRIRGWPAAGWDFTVQPEG